MKGKVDANAMSAVVADSARYDLFEFVDKALSERQSAARALRGLQNEGTDPLTLLGPDQRATHISEGQSESQSR